MIQVAVRFTRTHLTNVMNTYYNIVGYVFMTIKSSECAIVLLIVLAVKSIQ